MQIPVKSFSSCHLLCHVSANVGFSGRSNFCSIDTGLHSVEAFRCSVNDCHRLLPHEENGLSNDTPVREMSATLRVTRVSP